MKRRWSSRLGAERPGLPPFPGAADEAGFKELVAWLAAAAVIAIGAGLLGVYELAFAGLVAVACVGAWRSTRAACVAVAALSPIMAVGALDVGFNLVPVYPVVCVGLLGVIWRGEHRLRRLVAPDAMLAIFAAMAVLITAATLGTAPSGNVVGAAGVNGPELRPIAQLGALTLMCGVYALFRIGALEMTTYRSSLRALAASFCIVATYGAYQVLARLADLPYAYLNDRRLYADLPLTETYVRINSTLTEASPLSAFTIVILLLCAAALLASAQADGPAIDRRRVAFLAVAAVGIIVAAMSKAAILALALAAPLLLTARALRFSRRYVIAGTIAAATIGAGIVAVRYPNLVTAPADAIASERYVRVGYWLAAIDISAAHPLGVGTGNFAFYYPHYASISPDYEFYARITDAHNWFLEAYAETGIVGGSAFLAFTLTLIASGLSVGRRMATDEWGPSVTALTVAFVIFCLMHLTYSVFYYPFEWVVAGLIAARVAADRHAAPSATRASD